MSADLRRIPPAPRHVHWRKVLGYRWPLAAATFALAIYGGILTWLFFLANSERSVNAERFDRGPRKAVEAVVRATGTAPDGSQRVDFEFFADGQNWTSSMRVPGGQWREGQALPIEYLAGMPTINRIQGAPPDLAARQFDPTHTFVTLVVPGLLLGICWLAGVLHLRHVLAHGVVSLAEIQDVRRVRFCLPECLSVRFSFKDHRAQERTSRHWVRVHSPLGQRLVHQRPRSGKDKVPALHDRRFPQQCRLVLPEDFGPDLDRVDPRELLKL